MNSEIKVSVCVVTYNQERYIGQCLQSLIDQVTDFKFEIVVGEDCSSDGTREIIEEFHKAFPDIIKPIFREKNIGGSANYIDTHARARGDYIAHMDGDDYALPGKLQVQADFLDSNPHCNIVWHPMIIEMRGGCFTEPNKGIQSELYRARFYRGEIIKLISIGGNSSKMYRKKVREFDVPSFEVVDYFANVEQVGDGFAAFSCDTPLGVYRAGIGIASSGSGTREILAKTFIYFSQKYPEYSVQANVAALTYFVVDFKNLRPTAWLFFVTFIKTFKRGSVVEFWKSLNFIRMIKG